MTVKLTHIHNKSWSKTKPYLSVLIPFYKDDPTELLLSLLAQSQQNDGVEILIYDDGSEDPELNSRVSELVKSAHSPMGFFIADKNAGRAAARNALQENSNADWVLFLDADMRPVSETFIDDYIDLIKSKVGDVIFGGFTVPTQADTPDQELHRALSEVSDCLSLAARQAAGPQYVATSNLCVRKDVLLKEDFDHGFKGWGWEDSEWAARVAKNFTLIHADIPALHLGLESTDTLLKRFKTSGPNYVRFTGKHPEIAKTLTLFKISQKLRKIPGQKLLRPVLKTAVKLNMLPINLRLSALKMWRASWYAEAFSNESAA